MITKLTTEQKNGIAEWRKHCLKIGYDTSLINKLLVEKSWKKFYKILNKKEPKFWYCQSPLQAQIIINIFPEIQKFFDVKWDNIRANIETNIGNNIRDNIEANIGDNIRANIRDNIEVNIGNNIRANIGDNIWDNIETNIRANIGNNIRANIRDNIGANIRNNIWNNIGNNIRVNVRNNIRNNIRANIEASIWDNIGDNIGANIGANIGDNIRANIEANIKDNIRVNIEASIWDSIWDNFGNNIRDNIGANIRDNIEANIGKLNLKLNNTYSWCQHDIGWIAYYKYFSRYNLLPYDKNFEIIDIWFDLACSCGWCYTFENIVFVCEKPSKIYLNGAGQLHKDSAVALEYRDGYGLYMLHGIQVPEWLVNTPAEKIDPSLALNEINADVQREIIRKIGAERMLKASNAKILDIWDDPKTGFDYKLMDMSLGNNIHRKYLYFEHASMKGVYFAKPVPPETVKALHGLCWQRKLLTREELKNVSLTTEAELIANLPAIVC